METIETISAVKPKKKKTGLIIGIVSGVLAAVGGYFIFIYKDKDGKTYWKKWTSKGDEEIPEVEEPKEAPPAGVKKWIDESFPLAKGMWGGHIKILQKKLGLKDDGKFGGGTEKAVIAKFGKPTVDRAAYDSFISPVAAGGGANIENLRLNLGALAKNFKSGIYTVRGGENTNYRFDFYTNGRVIIYDTQTKKEVKRGSFAKGGKKIVIDKGKTYESTYGKNDRENVIYNLIYIVKDLGG